MVVRVHLTAERLAMDIVPSKNDTKSNKFFHPYGTRSRSDHDKNHPPDNTSVPGSSNTVVEDKPAAAGEAAATVIPRTLYHVIQLALSARAEWEAKMDEDSKLKLKRKEDFVQDVAYYYKKKNILPRSWTHTTASTLVPSNKDDSPLLSYYAVPEKKMNTKRCEDDSDSDSDFDSDYDAQPDPSTKLPEIYHVPFTEDETESWMQFKKLNEGNRAYIKESPELYDAKLPVNIEHPFVSVIGYFAVNGFNESYEMFIKKGECNHLRDPVFRQFSYRNVNGPHLFYMIIEAVEDGIRGLYKAKVRCTVDGERTLLKFSFTDGTNAEKELVFNACKKGFKILKDDVPFYSGMKRRMNAMGSTHGYDYFNPSEEIL